MFTFFQQDMDGPRFQERISTSQKVESTWTRKNLEVESIYHLLIQVQVYLSNSQENTCL